MFLFNITKRTNFDLRITMTRPSVIIPWNTFFKKLPLVISNLFPKSVIKTAHRRRSKYHWTYPELLPKFTKISCYENEFEMAVGRCLAAFFPQGVVHTSTSSLIVFP